jgi:hypothetical protein
LQALDEYYDDMQVPDWKSLPKTALASCIQTSEHDSDKFGKDDIASDSGSDTDPEDTEDDAFKNIRPDSLDTSPNKDLRNDEYYQSASFGNDHPQCDTHRVRLVKEHEAKVPDFVGGILPQHNKGNQEDYCMTMLTLFKPWRIGTKLWPLNTT